ncbi:MAG: hypothetical protein ACOYIS_07670 [Candidatus Cloacimonadaceae bacterium]|jgi:hypothetical protein
MPRTLLPKHENESTGKTTGTWLNFEDQFLDFADDIEISPDSVINVTSIPSPWARMLLFSDAVKDKDHTLHFEVMSSILDVIEIIFYSNILTYDLKTIELAVEPGRCSFVDILYDLYHDKEASDTSKTISLLLLSEDNGNDIVLAGSSPYTLLFTPLDLQKKKMLPRYFQNKPRYLKDRPREFQIWFMRKFLEDLNHKGEFTDLVNAFREKGGICKDLSLENPNLPDTVEFETPSGMFKGLFGVLATTNITSDNLIKATKTDIKGPLPLVIDTYTVNKDKPYYNGYTFKQDFNVESLQDLPRNRLPGEDVKYPWVLPEVDFLQPKIVKYKYEINDDRFVIGSESTAKNYLVPLTREYFKYFDIKDVNKYLSIQESDNGTTRVTLIIPVANGKVIVQKNYSKTNHTILDYGDKDDNTPLPYLIIWPNLSPQVWKDDYYAYSYGYRFDKNKEEVFSILLLDHNMSNIPYNHSRKAEAVEIFSFKSLPHFIEITHRENNVSALAILDHGKFIIPASKKSSIKVGIDFGTSHTNIAIAPEGSNAEILKYSSNFNKNELNTKDFIPIVKYPATKLGTDNIPVLIKESMIRFFMPNSLRNVSSDESVSLPLVSLINSDKPEDIDVLLNSSINFSKEAHYNYQLYADQLGKTNQEFSDLKWSQDEQSRRAAKEYLKTLLMLAKYELVKQGYGPESTSYYWSFPKSFSPDLRANYNSMWRGLIADRASIQSTDESKATFLYFHRNEEINVNSPGTFILIDVGGGSSDISIWHNRSMKLLYSTLWAGRDLIGYESKEVGSKFYSLFYRLIKSKYAELLTNYRTVGHQVQINYVLSKIDHGEISDVMMNKESLPLRFLILYFFSALFYEVGQQIAQIDNSEISSIDVLLAGNGSRFICWSSGDRKKLHDSESEFYEKILKESMGLAEKDIKISFTLSSDPKKEVALGICEGDEAMYNKTASHEPVTVENVSINKSPIAGNITVQDLDKLIRKDDMTIEIDKDNSKLKEFHDLFFDILEDTDLYRSNLKMAPSLNDLNALKDKLFKNENQILGDIIEAISNNHETMGTISSSIFILGMHSFIKRLHKELDEK